MTSHFFICIRSASSLGNNNIPTVPQFISSFKKLMAGAINKSNFGNCLRDDSARVLVQHSFAQKLLNAILL